MARVVKVLAGLMLLFSVQLHAADLNKVQVGQWLASYQAVQQWTKQHQDELLALDAQSFFDDDQAASDITNNPLYQDMLRVLASHGFNSAAHWSQVGEQIMLAYGASQQATIKQDFSKEIADIRNDPNMTAEQKEAMLSLLETTQQLTEQFASVTEADKQAVADYVDQITKLAGQ
ncbi:hypothetical protein K0504_16055 [Neiella marina]|uniref:LTXXQ motif family protein n=1 Tax=Neiella holothuriorum TaxID=2870530 RepID=A0ABS7EK02_9GAMM|nr:hypothetical protein [Neiella holothuriorum]MBW8192554.1 hypothetical protein [Neiella holothuriorum]